MLMSEPATAETVMARVAERLRAVPGIVAVVLGGSRASGTHAPDSDVDIGLYYRDPLDLDALRAAARAVDDERRPDAVTAPGGWGAWVNGGGWLRVEGIAVDLIERDLARVERVVDECHAGRVETHYHWGHPHAFVSTMYAGEVACCRPLWDPDGAIAHLQARLDPYPEALRTALTRQFGEEAAFTVEVARHGLRRGDVAYTAGCCFRAVACLMQVLHAHNRVYLLNEKGAVARAARLPTTVPDLETRVDDAFALLRPAPEALARAVAAVARLVAEGRALAEA
jgi:predicted nucleotidyltransferase